MAKPLYIDFGCVLGHSTEDDPLIVGWTGCRFLAAGTVGGYEVEFVQVISG